MNEELKPCWCGNLPEPIFCTNGGNGYIYFMCDQTTNELLPHALMADDAESEEGARQNWNRMMDAIEKHYQGGDQQ